MAMPPISDPNHPDHLDWQAEHVGGATPEPTLAERVSAIEEHLGLTTVESEPEAAEPVPPEDGGLATEPPPADEAPVEPEAVE